MTKSSLVSRMTKADAPQTWITEVRHLERKIEELTALKEEYLNIIDALARQLEAKEADE